MIQLKSTASLYDSQEAKVLVHGGAGTGKTTLCATTNEPALIISAEAGLMSLRDFDIPYIEVTNMEQLNDAYKFVVESAEAKQFKWICLDSISEVAEVVLNNELKNSKDPRQAYGQLQQHMTTNIRLFRDLKDKSVYFSCKQERLKDEENGRLLYMPSMPGAKLTQGISYFFDEVFALRVEPDEEGNMHRWLQTSRCAQYEAKDRSGALEQFEQPSLGEIAKKIFNKQPTTEGAE